MDPKQPLSQPESSEPRISHTNGTSSNQAGPSGLKWRELEDVERATAGIKIQEGPIVSSTKPLLTSHKVALPLRCILFYRHSHVWEQAWSGSEESENYQFLHKIFNQMKKVPWGISSPLEEKIGKENYPSSKLILICLARLQQSKSTFPWRLIFVQGTFVWIKSLWPNINRKSIPILR